MSSRTSKAAQLRAWVDKSTSPAVAIVIGREGVGKSTLIETALYRKAGVVELKPYEVVETSDVFCSRAIAGHTVSSTWDAHKAAQRVLRCYSYIFGHIPTIVFPINVHDNFEPVRAGIRNLKVNAIIEMPLRKLLDEPAIYENTELVVIKPLTREELLAMPDFQIMFSQLEETGLKEMCMQILGNNALAEYRWLREMFHRQLPYQREIYVKLFMRDKIRTAVNRIYSYRGQKSSVGLLEFAVSNGGLLPVDVFKSFGHDPRSFEYVFTKTAIGGEKVYIPKDRCIDIALKYRLTKTPKFEELKDIVDEYKCSFEDL